MGKLRTFISASAAILLLPFLAAAPSGAVNLLEDIGLQKAGDTVVVIITTSQPDEFNAFLLDTKPERIVVDLQGVTNAMTQKRFTTLPCKSVESIRTSQYKATPNLVARVVLDINRPIDFKSSREGNDILIKLPAIEGEGEFSSWQAMLKTPVPARQVAQAPKQERPAQEEKEPPAAKPKPPTTKPTGSGVQIESYPKRELVDYGTGSFRDPFIPLIGSFGGQLKGEIPSLENLKLVGILEDAQRSWALLEDSEGNGYMLTPNDKVKNGYLVSVSKNKAVFQITEYGWTRTVALELKVPELE